MLWSSACAPPPSPPPPPPTAADIYRAISPSVVAILNDDHADRQAEAKEVEASLGDELRAPKHVIDVSAHKAENPHGTGFAIEGGDIVTAAHVILRPDRLKVITRGGQTVDADVDKIDQIRDIALLRPRTPLEGVPPLAIDARPVTVGEPLWAMGHTGYGYWALSWGVSQGIASGTIDIFGARLVLFDTHIYPGFSGGPLVTVDGEGKPRVVGVNHASFKIRSTEIFSAVAASELRAVIAGQVHPLQPALASYAKEQRGRVWADLFITEGIAVSRDAIGQPVAHIVGNARSLDADVGDTRVPCAAMLFGLGKGVQAVEFELRDPADQVVASEARFVRVAEDQRVAFASTGLHFTPKTHGKYSVLVKHEGKEIGRTFVHLNLESDDDELVEEDDTDSVDDGQPDVDVIVAQHGSDDPLFLQGIRAAWEERSYPRRVDFSWLARGTRGWSGTNVIVTAFTLDETGNIVGRSDGCILWELRPEKPWSCVGTVADGDQPLAGAKGRYDIVFTVNDRPVAWWPMEAALRGDPSPGSGLSRWLREVERVRARGHRTLKADERKNVPVAPAAHPAKPAPKPPSRDPGGTLD
jgi:S1-C subfamily serine protease